MSRHLNEREKMLGGEQYHAGDPELVAARFEARRLTRQFGALDPADSDGRDSELRTLLGEIG